ncbi:hypothetical protein Q0M94_11795 [Deinococcus radiomollis]|uniref:hypothetical protein n=1 Tax=Deinococcus radiomollis TaxID=468916 RepID=UPI003891EC89
MDQPFLSDHLFVYQVIKSGHDYRYLPAPGEGVTARRGESCTARRTMPGQQPGTVQIVVEFADGEEVGVDWMALRGVRGRVRDLAGSAGNITI